jgi:hypothetical protein
MAQRKRFKFEVITSGRGKFEMFDVVRRANVENQSGGVVINSYYDRKTAEFVAEFMSRMEPYEADD